MQASARAASHLPHEFVVPRSMPMTVPPDDMKRCPAILGNGGERGGDRRRKKRKVQEMSYTAHRDHE